VREASFNRAKIQRPAAKFVVQFFLSSRGHRKASKKKAKNQRRNRLENTDLADFFRTLEPFVDEKSKSK
jgi:hypothetical protein